MTYLPFPPGTVIAFAGETAPSGWLLCDGTSYARLSYPELFQTVGVLYGSTDGNSFNVPDMRGRVSAGKDTNSGGFADRLTTASSGINARNIATTGGVQSTSLTTSQLPSHSHSRTGGLTGTTTFANSTHDHGKGNIVALIGSCNGNTASLGFISSNDWVSQNNTATYIPVAGTVISFTSRNHNTATYGNTDNVAAGNRATVTENINTSSTGSDTAYQTVQPTIVLNYIIKI